MSTQTITADSAPATPSRRINRPIRFGRASLLIVALAFSACGSDDDPTASNATSPTTSTTVESVVDDSTASSATPPVTSASVDSVVDEEPASSATSPVTSAPVESVGGVDDELCALAQEMFEMDDFPTVAMLERYRSLAPSELEAAVGLASQALIAAGDDLVAQVNVLGDDEVERAIDQINGWEEENCGIAHSEFTTLPSGATRDIDPAATRVDVTATDFAFDVSDVRAGRTSFVLTNEGVEAHFLAIVKLADGVTLEQFMASDDDSLAEGFWETGIGAGGGDEEAITFDVEPGNYAMVCFLPTRDGTPHTMLGMARAFTVS